MGKTYRKSAARVNGKLVYTTAKDGAHVAPKRLKNRKKST